MSSRHVPSAALSQKLWALLPRGGSLPDDIWRRRHMGIVVILWAHVPGIIVFALSGGHSFDHAVVETFPVALMAVAATFLSYQRMISTIAAAFGLLTSSAVLVHLSGGVIELHFHFFVMVGVVVLYQEWIPFLAAIGYVVLHHGIAGALDPGSVYNHPAAIANPWKWAAIHGLFILGMSVAGIAAWRLNEQAAQLRELGCEFAQGFLFARPQPADAITALLQSEARRPQTAGR